MSYQLIKRYDDYGDKPLWMPVANFETLPEACAASTWLHRDDYRISRPISTVTLGDQAEPRGKFYPRAALDLDNAYQLLSDPQHVEEVLRSLDQIDGCLYLWGFSESSPIDELIEDTGSLLVMVAGGEYQEVWASEGSVPRDRTIYYRIR